MALSEARQYTDFAAHCADHFYAENERHFGGYGFVKHD